MAYPTYQETYKKEIQVGDKTVSIEIGKFSEQVSAAVLTRCGDTMVHTTVALGRKVNLGYFPLSVEFAEKLYAGGIIKGSRWVKRDGRPTDDSILKARVIDRTLRPLFPDGLTNEVQIISTVFSFDGVNDPDMLALLGASIGVTISEIPFEGPVAGLRIGYNKETAAFSVNPTIEEGKTTDLDLIVSGTGNSIVMVEAGANEIPEEIMIAALVKAQEELGTVCAAIGEIQAEIGREKAQLVDEVPAEDQAATEALKAQVYEGYQAELRQAIEKKGRLEDAGVDVLVSTIVEKLNKDKDVEDPATVLVSESEVKAIVDELMKQEGRKMIINEKVRPDGRKPDEIRPIWCEVDLFPRTHGSAMFKRGATQAVTITTLGSPSLGQHIEDMQGEEVRHYMHHYNMPPYASGEAGRFGAPKRREIGHGALAERALSPMIPNQQEFPYTIHVVSEILSSNGSTSQASVCGSTLSLMAAGVPIKRPVAGIAMGLMSDGDNYVVLSDIQGLEDHVGDMDFKVAGTTEGITAIQMDIKLTGLTRQILEEALEQARVGRLHILDKMLQCIAEPRAQISEFAPKIQQLEIPSDRIGELIGPGGKMIKSIIAESGADIDVDEDEERGVGMVNISSPNQAAIEVAVKRINDMMRVVEINDEFDGTVTRVENYGAFVEYLPGREGLVHVSEMGTEYIERPQAVVKVGDAVHVRISEIKEDGKIGLSMLTAEQAAERNRNGGGGNRGGRGGEGGRDGGRGGRPSFRGGRGGGSHFGGNRSDRGDRGGRDGNRSGGGFRSQLT